MGSSSRKNWTQSKMWCPLTGRMKSLTITETLLKESSIRECLNQPRQSHKRKCHNKKQVMGQTGWSFLWTYQSFKMCLILATLSRTFKAVWSIRSATRKRTIWLNLTFSSLNLSRIWCKRRTKAFKSIKPLKIFYLTLWLIQINNEHFKTSKTSMSSKLSWLNKFLNNWDFRRKRTLSYILNSRPKRNRKRWKS